MENKPYSYNIGPSKSINIWSVIYQSRCDTFATNISEVLTSTININRGATPMPADAAWATPGFSGATPSGPRSHPRAGSGLRFAAATSHRFASAKQRCPAGARSLPGRLRTPRTPEGVLRGQGPEKPSADRESSKDKAYRDRSGRCQCYYGGKGSVCISAVRGGFFRLAPLARVAVRGVRRWRAAQTLPYRRVFQGLRRRFCEQTRAVSTRVRARLPTSQHRKNPE